MQMAYRILVATGEATDAEKLVPIEWTHLSGVITIQLVMQVKNFSLVLAKMLELK